MSYHISMSNEFADTAGNLGVVMLPHEPRDADKTDAISAEMEINGWKGRPVIIAEAGDYHIAITGTHRLAAAARTGIEVSAVFLPDDLTEEEWELIHDATDDDDLLAALYRIADGRSDMEEVIETMIAEIDSNDSN